MDATGYISAAKGFLFFTLRQPDPSVRRLVEGLDELALAYHAVRDIRNAPETDAPRGEYDVVRRALQERFPLLGNYASADATLVLDPEPAVADALDDLADIVLDLQSTVSVYEREGSAAAAHYFRESFEQHWGRHLRGLALYLHVNTFD